MVFVRKVRTASGATAVQIAEREGGRDRLLEHLGSAHTQAELVALVAAARRKVYPGQSELDLNAGAVPAGQAVITAKASAVLWHVLSSAYARLGFDAIGDESFKQLVLARIIEPTSKADSLRVLDGVEHASLRTMFRSLARCQQRGYRDMVASACFTHACTSGDVSSIVFTALAVARHLQNATGMSIKKIVRALRPLQQVRLTIAGHEHTAADPLTDDAHEIIAATGTQWPTH